MRVLLTGGAGFIGSHVLEELVRQRHEVSVIDDFSTGKVENMPKSTNWHGTSITDADKVAWVFDRVKPDSVIHLAAQMSVSVSMRDPVSDAAVNVMGFLNILHNVQKHGIKNVVFASSGGVYYGNVCVQATEDMPPNPACPYGISKRVGEEYLTFYAQQYGIHATALRYANVYGPRQNPKGEAGVVAIFLEKLMAGEQPVINGDGGYDRDYVYVADVALATVKALECNDRQGFTAYNIGTGQPTDVVELGALIRGALHNYQDKVPTFTFGPPRAGDVRSNMLSCRKARTGLGWRPTVILRDGLRTTIEWYLEKEKSA